MNHSNMIVFNILVANLLMILPNLEENLWELRLDKDDIAVYTRQLETSRFNEFKAETKTHGSIEKFKEIITDIKNYPDWVPDCKSANIVESPNENNIIYHLKLKVPFPFANRDITQQIILNETEDKLEVEIINRPNKVEEDKNYVRMPVGYGKWVIHQVSEDEIDIQFQYMADPGGNIPAWLVNTFVVKNPHLSMKNIRKLMAD